MASRMRSKKKVTRTVDGGRMTIYFGAMAEELRAMVQEAGSGYATVSELVRELVRRGIENKRVNAAASITK